MSEQNGHRRRTDRWYWPTIERTTLIILLVAVVMQAVVIDNQHEEAEKRCDSLYRLTAGLITVSSVAADVLHRSGTYEEEADELDRLVQVAALPFPDCDPDPAVERAQTRRMR